LPYSSSHPVVLATGLQSSGSSLVSWCFLQRQEMDGVLDGDTDIIPLIPPGTNAPRLWYKTTISSFTLQDQLACLEDAGFEVQPLLVVRDIRNVWASLAKKDYGRDGVTAEDPPLRLRFRRFRDSWEYAQAHDIPIIKFEEFLTDPEKILRRCCTQLSLDWDESMMTWPKPITDLADSRHGNATFQQSREMDLLTAIGKPSQQRGIGPIAAEDLQWLEEFFTDFNEQLNYPTHLPEIEQISGRSVPSWDVSRRKKWRLQQKPFRYLLSKLGLHSDDSRPA
jgi:hypothetical protein